MVKKVKSQVLSKTFFITLKKKSVVTRPSGQRRAADVTTRGLQKGTRCSLHNVQRSSPILITAWKDDLDAELLLVVCSVTVVAVSVGPARAPVTIAATLTPAGIVVSGASVTPTPGLKAATSIASVSSTSGEPTAPTAAPTEEASASSGATPISSGPVVRGLAGLVNSDLPSVHRLPIHSHHGIFSVIDVLKGDKPKASGSLGLPVLHHHHFRDLPVLGEDLLQRLLIGVEAQPSHEKLAFI